MDKSVNKIERQIEEQNKNLVTAIIERNRIISETQTNLDLMVPGYKLDSNGNFLSVNIKLAEMLDYSSEEELMKAISEGKYVVIASELSSLFANTDCVVDKPLYLRTHTGAFVSLTESILKCKEDGEIRYYSLLRYKRPNSHIKQDDITAWNVGKQIFQNIRKGVVVCDRYGTLVYANQVMFQILGYGTQDELPFDKVTSYVSEDCVSKMKNSIDMIFNSDQENPLITYKLLRNGGDVVTASVYSYKCTIGEKFFCVSIVSPDTQSKHRSDVSGMGSFLTYRDTFDIMNELYFLLSENGDICDLNASAAKMWGWDYKSYLTKSIFDLGSFDSKDVKRNVALLYDSQVTVERNFFAKNTIWGNQEMTCRFLSVGKAGQRYIAMLIDNQREVQQIRELLSTQYMYNLALLDNSICGIIVLKDNKIERVNSRAYALLRIKYDIRGEMLSEILKDTRRRKRHIEVTASNRKEEVFVYEVPSEPKSVQLEVHLYDVNSDETICYLIDRPLRRGGSVKITNAASRYRLIVEQSPCGVLIGDMHGDIIDVSNRFCEMIKMPPEEVLGKNISDLFTSISVTTKPFDYVRVDAGEIISAERELKCGDGTVKIVEMYSALISSDMYQAVVLDITDRKIYENQLISSRNDVKKMELQKRHFLKTSKNITLVFNENVEIKEVFVGELSPFFIYYDNEKDFVDSFIKHISTKENDVIVRQGVARALAGEVDIVKKDLTLGGINYIVEVRFVSMDSEVVMEISDVTEREHIIEEMRKLRKRTDSSEKLQVAFLGNLSHELRTPMNAIIGFADLLLEVEDNPEKQDYLRTILDSSQQLMSVLSDLIEMSKLDAGVMKAKTEIVNIKKIISDVCSLMRGERLLKENNVTIVNAAKDNNEVLIVSDNIKLRQIITNIISNAVKFSKNGEVEVGYTESPVSVCIYVRDNGVGISKEDLPNIFNRFFQTKNNELAIKGTGLGLAIVKSYVDMLNGTIRVESEEGKGSCFYVELQSRY